MTDRAQPQGSHRYAQRGVSSLAIFASRCKYGWDMSFPENISRPTERPSESNRSDRLQTPSTGPERPVVRLKGVRPTVLAPYGAVFRRTFQTDVFPGEEWPRPSERPSEIEPRDAFLSDGHGPEDSRAGLWIGNMQWAAEWAIWSNGCSRCAGGPGPARPWHCIEVYGLFGPRT